MKEDIITHVILAKREEATTTGTLRIVTSNTIKLTISSTLKNQARDNTVVREQ